MEEYIMKRPIFFILIITSLLIFSACVSDNENQQQIQQTNTQTNTNQENTDVNNVKVNVLKVEILHFHPKVQCYSCKTLGNYAEETINTYYSKELKNGRVTFRHINYELPENEQLVLLYKPPGSALCIGVYDDQGHLYIEENIGVWYRIENKDNFTNYMKQLIDMRLNGDLTKI
jgi:hypothetical protein